MKKSAMGIAIIALGVIAIGVGIVMFVTSKHENSGDEKTQNTRTITSEATTTTTTSAPAATSQIETSKEKGDKFENFVVNMLADWRLKLLDRTQDAVSTAGVVAESCKDPDLHVQQKRGDSTIDYYLECKYRSRWNNDGAVSFDDWQIDRYRKFQHDEHRKVVIALGVGGSSDAPETFMLVPLDSIQGNSINRIQTQFVCQPTSSDLVSYMNDYFTTVFKTARERKKQREL